MKRDSARASAGDSKRCQWLGITQYAKSATLALSTAAPKTSSKAAYSYALLKSVARLADLLTM